MLKITITTNNKLNNHPIQTHPCSTHSAHTHTDLKQECGVQEAEQVQQGAHNEQDAPVSQTGAVELEQMTRHQTAHHTCCPIQQLHSHHHLDGTWTHSPC